MSVFLLLALLTQPSGQPQPPPPFPYDSGRSPTAEIEPMTLYRPKGPVIQRPSWKVRPTGDDIAYFYPSEAAILGVEGRAVLQCLVHVTGVVRQCEVLSQTPAGWRFGDAAVSMSRRFRMTPFIDDGVAVSGGGVRIPLRFITSPGDAPPRTYEEAAYCLILHSVRLQLIPNDALSSAQLAPTRRLFEARAVAEKIPAEQKAADERLATLAEEETFDRLHRSEAGPAECLVPFDGLR